MYIEPGEAFKLPSGEFVVLEDFEFERYLDGTARKWRSSGHIANSLDETGFGFEVEVNRPFRFDDYSLYQYGYRESESGYESGLMIVRDNGRIYIYVSFAVIAFGLILTFIQRRIRHAAD